MTALSSAEIQQLLAKVPTGICINNTWRELPETFPVENPATKEVLTTVSSATSTEATEALDAAVAVQRQWARTSPRERSELLRRAFELVQERGEEFATLMTLEMGKPLAEARGEVTYGAEYLRWFAEEAVRNYGHHATLPEGTLRMTTVRKPVGPCLLITPWNFPLAMATRKVAPALAAGCVAVLKPARLTPLTSLYFMQTLIDAGLPAGVVNLVCSKSAPSISEPLLADARLRKVSFTGSTAVGIKLLEQAAGNVLRSSMELGGNAPFIVFEDADIEKAVAGAVAAKMRNIGEACTAANRFYVHESVADEFVKAFTTQLAELKVGNGLDADTKVGPLVEQAALDNVAELVDAAVAAGATVTTGGKKLEDDAHNGYFYAPTVLDNVAPDAAILREEIFGPVAPIVRFSSEEEVVEWANDTEYGLASYVFTESARRMQRMSDQLEYGLLGANTGVFSNAAAPFGGVKQSGLGREGGIEGIAEYSAIQYIGQENPYDRT